MTDRWDSGASDGPPRDERTVLIPAQSDLSPPPPPSPPSPSGGRARLPWVIAGVAVGVALVASFLALRDDDGDRLATSVADTEDTTSTTGATDDAKGLESPTGDTTPVDKPGNGSGTTTTTAPTTTSSDTTTTSTTTPDAPTAVDPALPPVYGSTALLSGFVPDPFTVGVAAGGPVNAAPIGGGCAGHVSEAPTFAVSYTAGALPTLRMYFIGTVDTTLVVRGPAGTFTCVDDSFGTLNPTIDFNSPASGRYDIWVGTYEAGSTSNGTLHITEDTANHP